jgi:positive regulator of sigma E activity
MPWAGNSHGDQAGHPIEAEIPAASLIMLALLCYLVPAFMVVAGAWAATVIFPETGDAAAVAGLVAGLFLTRWIIRAADLDSWARACVRIRAVQGRNS